MSNTTQNTLVLIKPDGLKKSLTGNILTKLAEQLMTFNGLPKKVSILESKYFLITANLSQR